MIRFGAIVSVVAVAIGLLIAGAVSGELTLVYVSIGLAALALLMLIVGVADLAGRGVRCHGGCAGLAGCAGRVGSGAGSGPRGGAGASRRLGCRRRGQAARKRRAVT